MVKEHIEVKDKHFQLTEERKALKKKEKESAQRRKPLLDLAEWVARIEESFAYLCPKGTYRTRCTKPKHVPSYPMTSSRSSTRASGPSANVWTMP